MRQAHLRAPIQAHQFVQGLRQAQPVTALLFSSLPFCFLLKSKIVKCKSARWSFRRPYAQPRFCGAFPKYKKRLGVDSPKRGETRAKQKRNVKTTSYPLQFLLF